MEICGFVLVRNCIFSMLEHSETKLQDVPFFSHLIRVEKERSILFVIICMSHEKTILINLVFLM